MELSTVMNKKKETLKKAAKLDFQRKHRFFATMNNLSTLLTRSLVIAKERLNQIYKSNIPRKKTSKKFSINLNQVQNQAFTPTKKVIQSMVEIFNLTTDWMSHADVSFNAMNQSMHEGVKKLKGITTLNSCVFEKNALAFERAVEIHDSDKLKFCSKVMTTLMPEFNGLDSTPLSQPDKDREISNALKITPMQTAKLLNQAIQLELFKRVIQFGKTLLEPARPSSLNTEEIIHRIDRDHHCFRRVAEHLGCQNNTDQLFTCCITNPAEAFCNNLENDFQDHFISDLGRLLTQSTLVHSTYLEQHQTLKTLKEDCCKHMHTKPKHGPR